MAGFATSNLSNGPQMPHATRDKQLLKIMKDFFKKKKKHKGSQVICFHYSSVLGHFLLVINVFMVCFCPGFCVSLLLLFFTFSFQMESLKRANTTASQTEESCSSVFCSACKCDTDKIIWAHCAAGIAHQKKSSTVENTTQKA